MKFILHYGMLAHVQVGSRQKLIGKEVIVAHRLLKNSVRQAEYFLFSENYLREMGEGLGQLHIPKGMSGADVGKINFSYYLLESLKDHLAEAPVSRGPLIPPPTFALHLATRALWHRL